MQRRPAAALVVLMLAGALGSRAHAIADRGSRIGNPPIRDPQSLKTETFDRDPRWDGHNNRSKTPPTRKVRQDFGYSKSAPRGYPTPGGRAGEIGGFVCPAAEPAYYAKAIPTRSFNDAFSASGTLLVAPGGNLDDGAGNTLLGFFNSRTLNEWRTPNSLAFRINGRGNGFHAHVEYATSRWRAGGVMYDQLNPARNRKEARLVPSGDVVHRWSLKYDPAGNGGGGSITATLDGEMLVCNLDPGHKADGATFDRFGLLNVMKSADQGGTLWIGDLTINGVREPLDRDPRWEGFHNRTSYVAENVRPRFNFGYSLTRYAGGKRAGECGGLLFRGDQRYPERMAYYGDRIEPLTLDQPLQASGKGCLRRGVTDSTVLFGFFHSESSMRVGPEQVTTIPENFLGAVIEGPSREGFLFYPAYGVDRESSGVASRFTPLPPHILPDGKPHDWKLEYQPAPHGGRITVSLDGVSTTLDVSADHRAIGARFNRFGFITTHIDGNGQEVFLDDLTYTCRPPAASRAVVPIRSGVAQLFVDDTLIAEQRDLQRTLHQPLKENGGREPVIALDKEFGEYAATLEANGTILYDPKLRKYVMFALGFSSQLQSPSADRVRMFRFTSKDGMHWVKGDDGTPERIAFDLRDPVSGTSATNIDLFSCTYDAADERYPYKGWLFFANWGEEREGLYYVRSPDGKRWERGRMVASARGRTLEQAGRRLSGVGDVTTFYADPESGKYLALVKFASPVAVEAGNRLRSRAYLFVDRLEDPIDLNRIERVDLVPPAAEAHGEHPTDEYYASTAWRYGSLWLGGLKIWHAAGDYPHSAAGSAFLKLVSSRDGLHWSKVRFPVSAVERGSVERGAPKSLRSTLRAPRSTTPAEVFIPNGPEGGGSGRNDGGYITEFSQGPLRIGDELIYYYGCSSWGKNQPREYRVSGGGIFRARLRIDGFVSVDRGTLTTRPLAFDGQDLFVNSAGPIRVEVLDPAGRALGAAEITGDSLRHRVGFDGRSLRRVAPGGAACLRFTVREGGRLYSFAVL